MNGKMYKTIMSHAPHNLIDMLAVFFEVFNFALVSVYLSLSLSFSLCVSVSVSPSLSLSSLSLSCSICMFVHLCIFRTRYLFLSLHSISRSTSLFTSLSSYLNFSIFISHSFSLAVYTTSPFFFHPLFFPEHALMWFLCITRSGLLT